MRWVKETLPSPLRWRYPLITLRLTSSSLAGTLRKLVAVGTVRLRAMLAAIVAPTPLIGWPGSPGSPVATGAAEPPGSLAGPVAGAAGVEDAASRWLTVEGGAVGTVVVAPFAVASATSRSSAEGAEAWAWRVGFDDL